MRGQEAQLSATEAAARVASWSRTAAPTRIGLAEFIPFAESLCPVVRLDYGMSGKSLGTRGDAVSGLGVLAEKSGRR